MTFHIFQFRKHPFAANQSGHPGACGQRMTRAPGCDHRPLIVPTVCRSRTKTNEILRPLNLSWAFFFCHFLLASLLLCLVTASFDPDLKLGSSPLPKKRQMDPWSMDLVGKNKTKRRNVQEREELQTLLDWSESVGIDKDRDQAQLPSCNCRFFWGKVGVPILETGVLWLICLVFLVGTSWSTSQKHPNQWNKSRRQILQFCGSPFLSSVGQKPQNCCRPAIFCSFPGKAVRFVGGFHPRKSAEKCVFLLKFSSLFAKRFQPK